jgi:hypothetical protein
VRLIKIVFVKCCENDADSFTKNVNKERDKHVSKFLGKMTERLDKGI